MSERRKQIALTMIDQIQRLDRWALARWGASDFVYDEYELRFKVRARRRNAKIIIKLTPLDLYDITYGRINRNYEWVEIGQEGGIYAEDLVKAIERLLEL